MSIADDILIYIYYSRLTRNELVKLETHSLKFLWHLLECMYVHHYDIVRDLNQKKLNSGRH